MRRHVLVLTALLGLSAAALAQAQLPQKPTPEQMQTMADASLERIAEAPLEAQLKVAERPETAERIATFKKNLFDALRRKGFTAEQSMQILNATALPSSAQAAK
jgi:hypothetical protein